VRAQVIVLAGPSGSGKSRLAARLGLPVLNLDDFYRDGDDPALPRQDGGLVDWDDPRSWRLDDVLATIETLCREGEGEIPVYDIAQDARTGTRPMRLGDASYFVAEGIFAPEVVAETRRRGLLADAICVRHARVVTFWRRFARDLHERRKPPLVLLRRGIRLLRDEPRIVASAVALGCAAMTPEVAYRRISVLLGSPGRTPV
jgi:uridine kinase